MKLNNFLILNRNDMIPRFRHKELKNISPFHILSIKRKELYFSGLIIFVDKNKFKIIKNRYGTLYTGEISYGN